ncbi:hypothetical protein HKCCE3408_05140 [Rhodobacterales bacterium HKCCE3408]|nr:hypothetical protein [Rhodobacterales bacterium HKCCE3408]
MRILAWIVAATFTPTVLLAQSAERDVSTLYRNSVLDQTMRVHVATFDADDGERYNAENCQIAAHLFQNQPGVTVRYWCEPGRFRAQWDQ